MQTFTAQNGSDENSSATAPRRRKLRLAIISTHPIQYYAPLFRTLARSYFLEPRVFYTWSQTATGAVFDPGFGKRFTWDIPLLDGYEHEFVPNVSRRPGSDHFLGIRNPELNRRIEAWGADAVLVYGWNLASHLGALRHFKGRIPVLFRGDSTVIDPQSSLRRGLRRLHLRWIYSHVDLALAVGQNNRDYYAWSGLSAERIAFAPHSVDSARFGDPGGEHERRAREWRRELGIPEDAVVLVFAAKFTPKKDPLLLLEAWLRSLRPAHLVFLGDGDLERSLREGARGRSDVHFLPFQNQQAMPSVYRLGDVYVLPSRGPGETWGLAMNEAMASGRPVIASSRVGGARDLVREGETGWTFRAGSREALGGVLDQAIAMGRPGLARMGESARELMREWSNEAAARAIEAAVIGVVPSAAGTRALRRA